MATLKQVVCDLYVNYPDNTNPPSFVWDSESGNLYVDIPER